MLSVLLDLLESGGAAWVTPSTSWKASFIYQWFSAHIMINIRVHIIGVQSPVTIKCAWVQFLLPQKWISAFWSLYRITLFDMTMLHHVGRRYFPCISEISILTRVSDTSWCSHVCKFILDAHHYSLIISPLFSDPFKLELKFSNEIQKLRVRIFFQVTDLILKLFNIDVELFLLLIMIFE